MTLPIYRVGATEILWSVVIRPFSGSKEGWQTYDLYFLTRPVGAECWDVIDRRMRGVTLSQIQLYARTIHKPIFNELFIINEEGAVLWNIGRPTNSEENTNAV